MMFSENRFPLRYPSAGQGCFRIMLLNSGTFSRIRQRRPACVSAFVPPRVSREHELEGLDISQHGEAL